MKTSLFVLYNSLSICIFAKEIAAFCKHVIISYLLRIFIYGFSLDFERQRPLK